MPTGHTLDDPSLKRLAKMMRRFERLFEWIKTADPGFATDAMTHREGYEEPRFGFLNEDVAAVSDTLNPLTSAVIVDVRLLTVDTVTTDTFTLVTTLKERTTGGPADDGIQPCVYRGDRDLDTDTLVTIYWMYGQWHVFPANCSATDLTVLHAFVTAFASTVPIAVGDAATVYTVPAAMHGRSLANVIATATTAGSGAGNTTIQLRRRRNGVDVDMLSTKNTIASGSTTDSTEVVDPANEIVEEGDEIFIDIDSISATAPLGLVLQLTFNQ